MSDDKATVRAKLTELVRQARICMLTTMTEDGRHVSRPMALQEAEFDGDLWFFIYDDSDKVREISAHPQVNVAFSDQKNSAWVSLSGRAEVVHDRARAGELWSPILKAWFPEGLDTTGLALLRVDAESAECWDSPGGRVTTLFNLLKSAVTSDRGEAVSDNAASRL